MYTRLLRRDYVVNMLLIMYDPSHARVRIRRDEGDRFVGTYIRRLEISIMESLEAVRSGLIARVSSRTNRILALAIDIGGAMGVSLVTNVVPRVRIAMVVFLGLYSSAFCVMT